MPLSSLEAQEERVHMSKSYSVLKKFRCSLAVFMENNHKPRSNLRKARCKDLSAQMLHSKTLDKWLVEPPVINCWSKINDG